MKKIKFIAVALATLILGGFTTSCIGDLEVTPIDPNLALPEDTQPYTYYLDLAAKAAKEVMDCGLYSLAPDYRNLFAADESDAKEYIFAIKNDLSGYLYKTTKRNPMILPVITEV